MVLMWASPIVYTWSMVRDALNRLSLPGWVLEVYAANPITIGVLGFTQTILPLLCYGLALTLPRIVFRNRRGLA